MFEKENRVIFLTPEEQKRKDAADARRIKAEEQKKLDEETLRVKAQTVAPAKETVIPSTGMANGIETSTIFEGGPTDTSAFDAVIEDAETPPEPAAPPPPDTPLPFDEWKKSGATAPGGYAGYVENYKPPEAEAVPTPLDTTAPWYSESLTEEENIARQKSYGEGTLKIGDQTEFQPDDDLYEQNRKTNADNAARAANNPDYTYTPLPENPQEAMSMQLGEQAEEMAFQTAQNQIMTELEDLGLERIGESVVRSIASARAQYVQGRTGGAFSTAKARIPKAVADSANRVLTEAKLKIQSSRSRRDYYEKQAKKAHADQNTELVKYFKKQAAEENARILAYQKAAEADALSIEQGMAAAVTKEKEEAMAKIDVLSDSPSTAAAMSIADFETLAVQAGFAESTARVFATATIADAKALLEAQKSKDVEAVRVAEANYQKTIHSFENPVIEKIEGYKKLKEALDSGAINQEAFDALSVDLGYAEAELSPLEAAKVKKTEAEAAILEAEAAEDIGLITPETAVIIPRGGGTEYRNDKGEATNPYIGKEGGSLTFRANNPAAISGSKDLEYSNRIAAKFGAVPGLFVTDAFDKLIPVFATEEEGYNAGLQLLDEGYSDLNIQSIAAKWTGETGASHLANMKTRGLPENVAYGDMSESQKKDVFDSIIEAERGANWEGETVTPTKAFPSFEKAGMEELDPTSKSILAQTNLSIPAYNFLTTGVKALTRMGEASRDKYMAEAEKWAIENNIDTSTFQSEYEAYNKVVGQKIEIAANVGLAGEDIKGSLDMLRRITTEAKFSDLRIKNVAKLWAGKEVNDPLAMEYRFNLDDLRSAITKFFASQEGRTQTTIQDGINAKELIGNGLAMGSIDGMIRTIDQVAARTVGISEDSVVLAQNAIWKMFGVEKPTGEETGTPETTTKADKYREEEFTW